MRTPKLVLLALPMLLASAAAPVPDAAPAATIELVSPIEAGPDHVVSDEAAVNSESFLFMAWSSPVSEGSWAEFHLSGPGYEETISTTPGRATVWPAWWDIPESAPEGRYVVTARLLDAGRLVATDETDVLVVQSDPASSSLYLNSNVPAGHGFYDPPGGRPGTKLTFYGSEGAEQVRGFYSTTQKPLEPVWKECGHARFRDFYEDPYAPVRCTLQTGDRPAEVTLVGGIANDTPPGESPDPARDGSGMAVVAEPYVVRGPLLRLSTRSVHEGRGEPCSFVVIHTRDQRGATVWSVPVDLHLDGEPQEVSFGDTPETVRVQAPADGHAAARDAAGCNGEPRSSQASHSTGQPVHAELVGGTASFGETVVGILLPDRGSVRAWIDEDMDDRYDSGETTDVILYPSDHTISVRVHPRSPHSGDEVELAGSLDAPGLCAEWRPLELQARWDRASGWRTVEETHLGQFGDYVVGREVRRAVSLRVVASDSDHCGPARSRAVRIVPR